MLNQVRSSLLMQERDVPGPLLVMYPLIPRSVFSAKRSATAWAAADALAATGALVGLGGAENSSDSEEDCFTEEGQLPEVLTKAATTMSKWDRETALARDRFQIDSLLGQHDLTQVCPKSVTFSFKADASGSRSSEKGLLLTKPPASGGFFGNSCEGQGFLDTSALLRDGMFVELEAPNEFVNVNKKFSVECRRSQTQGWKTEGLTTTSRNYVTNKVARGQLGWQTYAVMLTDVVKHCSAPNLLVNDFMAGVGEVGIAALRVKVSEVAKQAGVRVFYWGCDDRRVFAEIACANIRTGIGEAFLARELVVPGLEPVQPPPPKMASGISKASVEKFLPAPLAQLSLAADGTLAIPTEKELTENPPVPLTPKLLAYFENLRAESAPQAKQEELASAPPIKDGKDELATGSGPQEDQSSAQASAEGIFKCGETVVNRSELHGLLHKQGPNGKIRKELQQSADWGLVLLSVEDTTAPYRVLLENRSSANLKLAAGTFVGRGGPGSLVSAQPTDACQQKHAWVYTRCHEWKRDIATRANGFWVLKKSPASGGQTAASDAETPRMQTLEEIQSELGTGGGGFDDVWAHCITRGARVVRLSPVDTPVWWVPKTIAPEDPASFDASSLGAWLPSREQQTATGLECTGLLRPAFEVQLDGANKKTLTPDANPASGNPLCLFLKKTLIMKPGQLVVL